MRKKVLLFTFLSCLQCQAAYLPYEGTVHQIKGFYCGSDIGYLNLDTANIFNKTIQQQLDYVNQLNSIKAYGFSNWHIADEGEIFDFIDLYAIGTDKHKYLATTLGLQINTWRYFTYVSYKGEYKQIKLDYYNYAIEPEYNGWRTLRQNTNLSASPYLGAFVIATPEPSTLLLIAFGALILKRNASKLNDFTKGKQ